MQCELYCDLYSHPSMALFSWYVSPWLCLYNFISQYRLQTADINTTSDPTIRAASSSIHGSTAYAISVVTPFSFSPLLLPCPSPQGLQARLQGLLARGSALSISTLINFPVHHLIYGCLCLCLCLCLRLFCCICVPSLQLTGVLVFSAIPFTAVKAIANSSLGEKLRKRLEETKREAVDGSSRFRAQAQRAREDRLTVLKFSLLSQCCSSLIFRIIKLKRKSASEFWVWVYIQF